jgi:deoxyribonuclease IV
MLAGAHVSIAGGLSKSIERGEEIGADFVQSFATSPRTMKFKPIDDAEIARYLKRKQLSTIEGHVFHGVYLINLAHENPDYVQVCVDSLMYYQRLAAKINGLGTVFHTGSHKGKGFEAVLSQVAEAIGQIVDTMAGEVWLLLENTAGQNGAIGQSIEELALILDAVDTLGHDTSHLGICLDSQHSFASGIDLREQDTMDAMLTNVERLIGLEKLRLIHINDSKSGFGSHLDRHENVGEGELGDAAIKSLLTHPKLTSLPFVLEVPGENKSGPRKVDVDQLRRLGQE